MRTAQITVTDVKTGLVSLLETAGLTFPNDNTSCIGILLQIEPAETGTVTILSEDETNGPKLAADGEAGAKSIMYPTFNINQTYLIASADTLVNVQVMQYGG